MISMMLKKVKVKAKPNASHLPAVIKTAKAK